MAAGVPDKGFGVDRTDVVGFRTAVSLEIQKWTVIEDLRKGVLLLEEANALPSLKKYFELGSDRRIEELVMPDSPLEEKLKYNFTIQHDNLHGSRFPIKVDDRLYAEEGSSFSYAAFKEAVL